MRVSFQNSTCQTMRSTTASVLVGILWCLALLSVVVVGVLHSARLDLLVVKNHGDKIQAHYLALAGIEKAKALLYREAGERKKSARNHSGELYDAPQEFRDVPFGRGQFRVFHPGRADAGGKIVYGISDEESRLNVNRATAEELTKLPLMTPEAVAGILDWRDPNDTVTPNGAEAEYYLSLSAPYLPRNGPLQTVRELLMVRGVSRELFMGEEANQNGLDPEEGNGDGILDAGLSALVTVDSSVAGQNAAGEDRVNVQSADEKALSSVRGISAELAKAIIAYRGQNKLENLADLLNVAALAPQGKSPGTTQTNNQTTGPKLISEQLLMEIADDVTVADDSDQAGAININTASPEVLACLPGLSKELAQAIVAYRKSAGFFPNIAVLLKVDGMNREIFKQVAPKVSARSETFRILSEGQVTSTGARKRIQVIVRLGSGSIDTLSYREDL